MRKIIVLLMVILFTAGLVFGMEPEVISEEKVDYKDVKADVFYNLTTVISKESLKSDLEMIKYLLSTSYAGYDDAVKNGLDLEKFEKNVLSAFENEENIDTEELGKVVYEELKPFINDSHFGIFSPKSKYALSEGNLVFYSDIFVKEKKNQFVVVKSGVKEVKKGDEFTDSKEKLFLYPAMGENVYRLGFLKQIDKNENSTEKGKFSINNEEIEILCKNYSTIERKPNFSYKEASTDKTGYFYLSTFMMPDGKSNFRNYAESSIQKMIGNARNFKDKENIIIDLRSNGGGSPEFIVQFFYQLYFQNGRFASPEEAENLSSICQEKYGLFSPGVYQAQEKHIKAIYPPQMINMIPELQAFLKDCENAKSNPVKRVEKMAKTEVPESKNKFKGKVIIIVDRFSASASEFAVMLAESLFGKDKNFYLVGENTAGCLAYGGVFNYQLISGSLNFSLCNIKNNNFYKGEFINFEGKGLIPDYWTTNEDLVKTLVEITGDKKISSIF